MKRKLFCDDILWDTNRSQIIEKGLPQSDTLEVEIPEGASTDQMSDAILQGIERKHGFAAIYCNYTFV